MSTAFISEQNKKVFTQRPENKKQKGLKKAKSNPLAPSFINIDRDIKEAEKHNPKLPVPPEDIVPEPAEQLFIDLITDTANPINQKEAVAVAFPEIKDTSQKAKNLRSKPNIKKHIERRQELNSYKVDYTESKVLDCLWKEATREGQGSSHTARIQALVKLGEHIGMFSKQQKMVEEEGESKAPTYNIINYNVENVVTPEKIKQGLKEEAIDAELITDSDVEEINDDLSTGLNIHIASY